MAPTRRKKPAFAFVIANGKGGVGKTTTAVLVADLIGSQLGGALLLDLDPSAAATTWAMAAEADDRPLRADVQQLPEVEPATMPRLIRQAADGFDWLVVDLPPFDRSRTSAAIEAALVNGGMVIVPTAASDLDLPQTLLAVEDVEGRVPVVVLLTQTRARTKALREAREALTGAGCVVLEAEVPLRESLRAAPSGPLDRGGSRGELSPIELYEPVVRELLSLFADGAR